MRLFKLTDLSNFYIFEVFFFVFFFLPTKGTEDDIKNKNIWYGDETVRFCRRDMRVITDGCSLLRGCWNAFFKNMLFKRGSLSESQMAASPTGNIRSFCSEDALG